jgi:hypothetical protein
VGKKEDKVCPSLPTHLPLPFFPTLFPLPFSPSLSSPLVGTKALQPPSSIVTPSLQVGNSVNPLSLANLSKFRQLYELNSENFKEFPKDSEKNSENFEFRKDFEKSEFPQQFKFETI